MDNQPYALFRYSALQYPVCILFILPLLLTACTPSYPYMDQPIESINYWIGYYPDTAYGHKEEYGTVPLTDTGFVLDRYRPYEADTILPACQRAQMQLTFAFIHARKPSDTEDDPWRVANQGGVFFGTALPLYINNQETGAVIGPFYARSTETHFFDFKWGFKDQVAHLPPGAYGLEIRVAEAAIPSGQRARVEQRFSPKYYPAFTIPFVIPASCFEE